MGIYERLGVKTFINASGNGTVTGGSIMRPEVVAAMQEASQSFVEIPDLLDKAGRRIADLAGVEAAYITSGAAGGVAIATAACMTGKDWARIHQLPNTTGMKNEVIIQVMQRNYYELMIRLAGAKLIEVGLANKTHSWHVESAINERTAAIVHFCAYSPPPDLPIQDVITIAHAHGVPVIVDAAAEFPPVSNLRYYWDQGADLTIFSGGKGIRGPQSSALILGRRDLIDACAMNASPNHGIGRPMKVGKEEIVGLLTAVELFANPEFERAEMAAWEERTAYIVQALSDIPGVTAYRGFTPHAFTGHGVHPTIVPLTHVEWDQGVIPRTKEEVARELRVGTPAIRVPVSLSGIMVCPNTLQPGEEKIVADRLMQALFVRERLAATAR
jgi:uncharacterized pyridoxal phosphate-dependent enzyme